MNISKYHYQLILFPIFLLIVIFVLWASLMKIGEFVRAQGKIVPSGNLKEVQHLEGGIISEILIKPGDMVKQGQVLFKIRNEAAISELAQLQTTRYARLASEARLRALLSQSDSVQFPSEIIDKVPKIIENERKLFDQIVSNRASTISVLRQEVEQRRLDLQQQRDRIQNLSLQYKYAQEQEKILEKLVKSGAGSEKDLIDSKLKTQNLLTDLVDSKNKSLSLDKSINEALTKVEEAQARQNVESQTELSSVLLDLERLKEQISTNIDKVYRTEIPSPVEGVIRSVRYNTIGGIIRPGDIVADILPTDEVLLVDAKVLPRDRARIWLGQDSNIKLTAYDSSIHGMLHGKITEISADTFLDQGTREEYYSIKIESNLKGLGVGRPIYAGMLAEIDIVSGERTIMEYLLKPILKVFSNSLTEN